ncbi:MAG: right-handed parallel beta-helix repeat-containing protein [Xanthomonadales bacterium]|nr:right-handed parallel beta-helix repeat-containing protein [Xanthomonadales bacterium]
MYRILLPLAVLTAGMLAVDAARADGVIEINQDCAMAGCMTGDSPGFPVTITAAGHYRLTSDLSIDTTSPVINAFVDGDVRLDLNGFTVRGPTTCSGTPVTSCSFSPSSSCMINFSVRSGTLRNGTVRGGAGHGVCGGFGWGFVVQDVLITENPGEGIRSGLGAPVNPSELAIERVRVVRNGGNGINLTFGGDTRQRITNSVFIGNGGAGARTSSRVTLLDNQFYSNALLGFHGNVGSPQIALGRNTFFDNNGDNANPQYNGTVRDMGGNVCAKATCP